MQSAKLEIDAIVAARGRAVRAERLLWLARKPPLTWKEYLIHFEFQLEVELQLAELGSLIGDKVLQTNLQLKCMRLHALMCKVCAHVYAPFRDIIEVFGKTYIFIDD